MSDRTLITGATGFIGSHLAKSLVEKGKAVRSLVRRSSHKTAVDYLGGLGAELVLGDLIDKQSLRRAVEGVSIVFHLGGGGRAGMSEDMAYAINVEGTRNLLDACVKHGAIEKFVHASTCGVMGDIQNPPADETYPYNPENMAYSRAKTEAERDALSYSDKLPLVVVRYPGVYGRPLMKGELSRIEGVTPMSMIFSAVKKGDWRYIGDGKNLVHWACVDDVVQGLELAAQKGRPSEVYIIADEKPVTMEDTVRLAARFLSVDEPKSHIPVTIARTAALFLELRAKVFGGQPRMTRELVSGFLANRAFDITKARRELGYEPKVSLESGLKETIEWYEANGYLQNDN